MARLDAGIGSTRQPHGCSRPTGGKTLGLSRSPVCVMPELYGRVTLEGQYNSGLIRQSLLPTAA